jgi:hypothetical protein
MGWGGLQAGIAWYQCRDNKKKSPDVIFNHHVDSFQGKNWKRV